MQKLNGLQRIVFEGSLMPNEQPPLRLVQANLGDDRPIQSSRPAEGLSPLVGPLALLPLSFPTQQSNVIQRDT